MTLAYCDMMAYSIKENLEKNTDGFFKSGPVDFDLAKEGYMQSTTKYLSLIHISEPRDRTRSRMPSSA